MEKHLSKNWRENNRGSLLTLIRYIFGVFCKLADGRNYPDLLMFYAYHVDLWEPEIEGESTENSSQMFYWTPFHIWIRSFFHAKEKCFDWTMDQ